MTIELKRLEDSRGFFHYPIGSDPIIGVSIIRLTSRTVKKVNKKPSSLKNPYDHIRIEKNSTQLQRKLIAEEKSYRQELIEQTKALSGFKKVEGDEDYEWKLKKQKEVIEETKKMIPDAQLRLSKSLVELQELVGAHEEEWAGTEELLKAKELIKDGEEAVEAISKT
ncbi:uncharacterized protein MELLADRAFT_109731 [Melampsora larici-populina 98AG31]|uniref:Tubulin-specific chaperone A n=1 Tax=Melampsora larici-populina (strain 98AG31 / pathotype 3-4-7) TaxID=747676 RepID=F4RXF5_MELLP|nr:uncharacterized protein MELLADRAFT_109731 [Melampsora larici-populina 98AG31]EGG02958.1 hypothetical protein MELLADRAFT_109731 [Melampsora larici-populina 98AG31]